MEPVFENESDAAEKQFEHFYIVVDLDKRQKGKLSIVNSHLLVNNKVEGGPYLKFESINGRTIWKENINDIQSIEKVAQSEEDLRLVMTDESKSVFFRFLTDEAKLEITLILSKINTRIRLLDDSIIASADGSSIIYKVNMVTKTNRHPKTIEVDLITGTITRRGTGNIRDIMDIDHDLVVEASTASDRRQLTYRSFSKPNVPPCTIIFSSCIHVYDFISHIIKIRENLPQRPKKPYNMKDFERLNLYGKSLMSYLERKQFSKIVNDRGEHFYQEQDFLKAMRNLPPLLGFMNASLDTIAKALSQYGIVSRDVNSKTWGFKKNGCGSNVTIRTVTWNVGEAEVADLKHIEFLLFGSRKIDKGNDNCILNKKEKADIYSIGLQECKADDLPSYVESLERVIGSAAVGVMAGGDYTTLVVQSMWKIHLILIVRKSILPHISNLCKAIQKTGALKNMVGNKGGIGIYMTLFGTTKISFVTCHLAARQSRNKKRAVDFHYIVSGLSSKLTHCTAGLLESCDHSFWMGDLNYRVDFGQYGTLEEYNSVAWLSKEANKSHYDKILEHDQLRSEMMGLKTFVNFREGDIKFAPSYRCERDQLLEYNNKRNQNPSYCDRILWHSHYFNDIVQEEYNSINTVDSSDHKPVYANFKLTCRRPYLAPTKFGNIETLVSKPRIMIYDLSFKSTASFIVADDDDAMSSDRPVGGGSNVSALGNGNLDEDVIEEDNSREYFSVLRTTSTTSSSRSVRLASHDFHEKNGLTHVLKSKNFVNTLRKRDHRDSVYKQIDHFTEKTGWLYKKRQGTSLFKPSVWQKRWVQLKNYYIVYRRTSDPNSPIMASIDIRNVSRCQVAEKSIIFLFCAAFRSGVYPLKAKNDEDAIAWSNVINERINSNLTAEGSIASNNNSRWSTAGTNLLDIDEDDDLLRESLNSNSTRGSLIEIGSPTSTSDGNTETELDVNLIMNGALCVRFESECLHHSEKSSNIMPKEIFMFGQDANNKFPLDANINFIKGVNVEISKMVMRNERDLSYMAYTIVTYLDHDMSTPVSTVTRSYLQFEELNSMILRKIPSLEDNIEPLINQNPGNKKNVKINYESERNSLEYFIKSLSKTKDAWTLPEFHQFLDDFVNFETQKTWNWDNADMRPLTSTLDDTEWLKMQKIRCHIEDGNSRIRGINSASSSLCGVLSFETLKDDGSFVIPVQRNNIPHGVLTGRVSIDVFNPELEAAIIQNKYDNNTDSIQQLYNNLYTEITENISICVSGSKLMALEEKNPFTAYIIEIKYLEKSWIIERRFRSFHEIHKSILDKMPFLRNHLPKFPEKTFFGKLKQNIVKIREAALSEYLKHLVKIREVWNSSHFVHFIDNSEMLLLKKMHKIRCFRVAGMLSKYEVLPTDPSQLVGGEDQYAKWQGAGAIVGRQKYALSVVGDRRTNVSDMTDAFGSRANDFNEIRNKFEKKSEKNKEKNKDFPPVEGGIYRDEESDGLFTNTGELHMDTEDDEKDDNHSTVIYDYSNKKELDYDKLNPGHGRHISNNTINSRLATKSMFREQKNLMSNNAIFNSISNNNSKITDDGITLEDEYRKKNISTDMNEAKRSNSWMASNVNKIPNPTSVNSIRFIKVDGGCILMSTDSTTGKVHLSFCKYDNDSTGNRGENVMNV